jgi:branched-chain amino acid transport system permease protein
LETKNRATGALTTWHPRRRKPLPLNFSSRWPSRRSGWLYAYQRAFVSADVLEIYFLILMLTAVVLVGRRLLLGPLIGIALILMQEKFLSLGAYVDRIILGSVLIIVLAFLPRGLVGLPEVVRRLVWRRAAVSQSDPRLEKTGL